ncbi:ABC transporter ATP-binding protein [Lacticaseibacillus hulanensis]|uniref:ABC transporter ATP-binding protein n=1 Tax=Lacticaseibacillus hulanensis TaxID=2493111 RepID=UPI000FDAAB9F|nr:ATP-binding cassette domain-containing protein [Lacticaseibacillus hulanensis]
MSDIFTLKDVGYAPGGKVILANINLTIAAGAYLTISGPSGSGKSTLLRLLATLLTPTSGMIMYQNEPQTAISKPAYRREVSYCFQQPSLFGETVQDNLEFPFTLRDEPFAKDRALAALTEVDLAESMLTKPITELSGGEKQRVALIRNLLFTPKVLLLDEITTGLDAETKNTVHELIRRKQQSGVTVIAVTHDESEIAAADTLLTIKAGRLEDSHE